MRKTWWLLVGLLGCGNEVGPGTAPTVAAEAPAADEAEPAPSATTEASSPACAAFPGEKPETFGAALAASGALVPLSDIAADPEAFAGKRVRTTGVVRASCLKRGCWMEVRPETERDGASITVRFKDYAFFVPLDSRGAHVAVDGRVVVRTLSRLEVEHLEEEGADVAGKLPDGTAKQIQVTATGVEMCGRKR